MATAFNIPLPVSAIDPSTLPDMYASQGAGDCLVPVIPADAALAFGKREPVEVGDIAVFWFTPEAAQRYRIPGWVKRLAAPLPPEGFVGIITVEMLNPHRRLTLRSTDVVAVHKCIGEATLRGNGRTAVAKVGLREIAAPGAIVSEADAAAIRLELFDTVPPSCAVHAAADDSMAPLIRKGEIAVIEGGDRPGWLPQECGLFLIEHQSTPTTWDRYPRRTRNLIVTRESTRSPGAWYASPLATSADGVMFMSDGPYRDFDAIAEKLIGRVIGVYRPSLPGRVN